MNEKIGIIGGGACGIGLGKSLVQAGLDFEIIEATSRLGGNWQPDGPASKMYRSAHLISSKNNTQFTDYQMPEHYPAYPGHPLFFAYLQQLSEEFGLYQKSRLNTQVDRLEKSSQGWRCHFSDGTYSDYGFMIIANGLLRQPIFPDVASEYTGESIHSCDYKESSIFKGKRVLIVGAGNSGCDIAVDAAHTAKKVFHSTRRGYHYMPKFINGMPTQEWLMAEAPKFTDSEDYWQHVRNTFQMAGFNGVDYGLPEPDHDISECHPIMNSQILYHIGHGDIHPKPNITRCEGKTVFFSDGTAEEFDCVIWASGYRVDLPFLSRDIFDWEKDLSSLFLRMIPEQYDNLLFLGYLNTPSGIGNLVNILSRFVVAYYQAKSSNTHAWQVLQAAKCHADRLDLGQDRFMKTDRHSYEVDLWKYIKSLNFVTTQLRKTDKPTKQQRMQNQNPVQTTASFNSAMGV